MNRRDILKLLPALTALPAVRTLSADSLMGAPVYKGFRIWWSGWQKPFNMCIFCGHWVAQNPTPDRFGVYSAYPGATYKTFPGMLMDVSIHPYQKPLDPFSPEEAFDLAKADAYLRLIKYIDLHYEELTK